MSTTKTRYLIVVVKLVAAVTTLAAALVVTSSAANASTPPATYSLAHNACLSIDTGTSKTSYVYTSRPIAAAHYTGTTQLYWSGQLQMLISGTWYVVGSYDSAYAHIWSYSGTQLTPIYWGGAANNYGVVFTVMPGHSYRVIGQTYWSNGQSWFASDRQMIVGCNF